MLEHSLLWKNPQPRPLEIPCSFAQAGTNYILPVHKLLCTQRCLQCMISCTQKLCIHVAIMHWSKYVGRNPLPDAVYKIQITNPQCLMSAIDTFNLLFFKAIPIPSCKSVQYWVPSPSYIVCFERAPLACVFVLVVAGLFFVLGPSVKYPRCQNRKEILHRGLPQRLSQVLFTVVILHKHTTVRWH